MNISKAVSNISQENFTKWFKQSCGYVCLPTMPLKVYKVFQEGRFVYNFLTAYSYYGYENAKFDLPTIEWRGFNLFNYTREEFIYQKENLTPEKIQGHIRAAYEPFVDKQNSYEMEPCILIPDNDFDYGTIDLTRLLKEII